MRGSETNTRGEDPSGRYRRAVDTALDNGGVKRKHLAIAALALCVLIVGVAVAVSGGDGDGGEGAAGNTSSEVREPSGTEEPPFAVSGTSNVYVVDVATRAVEQVTANEAGQIATGPAWSPTGGIVFSEAPSGDDFASLFVIRPDGSGRRRLPTRLDHLFVPTWAPDGKRVAFVRLGTALYVFDLRTDKVRRLKRTSRADDAPAWSPDGDWIAFQRQMPDPTNLELYLTDPAGTKLRRLTRDPLQQITAAWSPDGSTLAFAEQQRTGHWAVATMRLDRSRRKLLTDPNVSSQDPAWSPDGKQIAYVLQGGEQNSIAVIDADGGKPVRITPREFVQPESPYWSPDGKQIVFAARRAARPPPSRAPAP
jgi:TolB protein